MAIVVNDYDVDFIKEECAKENLEVVQVATVTDTNRLVMKHMGKDIVNISRDFLDAAGAKRYQNIEVELPNFESTPLMKKKEMILLVQQKKYYQDYLLLHKRSC